MYIHVLQKIHFNEALHDFPFFWSKFKTTEELITISCLKDYKYNLFITKSYK